MLPLIKSTDLRRISAAFLSFFVTRALSRSMTLTERPLDSPIPTCRGCTTDTKSSTEEPSIDNRGSPISKREKRVSSRLEALKVALQYNLEDVVRYIIASFGPGSTISYNIISFYYISHLDKVMNNSS